LSETMARCEKLKKPNSIPTKQHSFYRGSMVQWH
jgi:hypothetical protein